MRLCDGFILSDLAAEWRNLALADRQLGGSDDPELVVRGMIYASRKRIFVQMPILNLSPIARASGSERPALGLAIYCTSG